MRLLRLAPLLVMTPLACREPRAMSSADVELDSTFRMLEMLRDSLPAMYEPARALYLFEIQVDLNRLGFRGGLYTGDLDRSTIEATREYETTRQLPVTGNPFARRTYTRLKADAARANRALAPDIGRRWFDAGGWNEGYVSVEGPWVAPGIDIPAAIRIKCYRARRECVVAEAEYGDLGLVPLIDHYDIDQWDAAEIRSRLSSSACQRIVLILNRVEESATLERRATSSEGLCSAMTNDTSTVYNNTAHLGTQ